MAKISYSWTPLHLTAPSISPVAAAVGSKIAAIDYVTEPEELNPECWSQLAPGTRRMVWCTCCERNQKFYLRRVKCWYEQLQRIGVEADYYVFNDGKLVETPPEIPVHWVEQPFLGRKDTCVFPGWKRSFGEAMRKSLDYDACLHVESDFAIRSEEKFRLYLNCAGSFAAWDRRYHMIEPSLMILNVKSDREKLAAAYANAADYQENVLFENRLASLLSWKYPFKTFRLEGLSMDDPRWRDHDGFGQAF